MPLPTFCGKTNCGGATLSTGPQTAVTHCIMGELGSCRRVFNDNRWGIIGIVCLSFEIPFEWLEEAVDMNSVPDNFRKVNLSTRRFLKKVLPNGQLIMDISSPEVTQVVEAQMGEII